ncbi:restriction endonuclease subunit S [Acinetobacter sp. CAAS 2-6]|uniref:restriction endonuclease subunit S n=1 Tax=Acinetobacter sp. CAAS 2-6 TaxID=3016358 RepID=UPI002DD6B4A8|nr:restriction endonuclease subunit S [Acinetobacter sp. CAAS 2-6]
MTFPVSKFTDIVLDKSGGNKKLSQDSFLSEGTYPVIDQGKNFIAGFINDKEYLVKSTDLPVVIFGDHTKAIKYVDFPFVMGADGVKVLKPKPECDTKYLYQYLRYAKIPDAGYSRHYKFLKELNIPLPSLDEQRRIASILDKADELRQKRQQAIEKLDQLLQATFIDMFGDPVLNNKKFPTKILGELGNWSSGGTPSRTEPNYFRGEIPWYTSGELNAVYIEDSIERISELAIERSSTKLIPVGSLLIGMYDTAAFKSSITTIPSACNQAIAFSKLNSNLVNTLYIYFAIQLSKDSLKKMQRGVRQKNLNLSMVKGISIPIPDIELQNKFAKIHEKFFEQKVQLNYHDDELYKLFKSLQNQAFSGNL